LELDDLSTLCREVNRMANEPSMIETLPAVREPAEASMSRRSLREGHALMAAAAPLEAA
jgi:hypothetical protein